MREINNFVQSRYLLFKDKVWLGWLGLADAGTNGGWLFRVRAKIFGVNCYEKVNNTFFLSLSKQE